MLSALAVSDPLVPPKAEKVEKAVTTVRLDPELLRDLDKIAAEEDRSRGSLIAFAVRRYVSWYQDQKKPKK